MASTSFKDEEGREEGVASGKDHSMRQRKVGREGGGEEAGEGEEEEEEGSCLVPFCCCCWMLCRV